MCVDLHTHSIFSDGTATPAELIAMASKCHLSGLALTDHDTVEGVAEFLRAGQQEKLTVISGLEISTRHRETSLHMLGYGFDPHHPEFLAWLDTLQQGRILRNTEILEKLGKLGLDIDSKEIEDLSGCGQTGRPHFARLLVNKGYVKTMNSAFTHYLGKNKPAWCPRFSYTAAESIAIIHKAGGLAVLAHPGQLDPSGRIHSQLIYELKEHHLDGVEVFHPSHTRKMQKKLNQLAVKHDLLITGGSDFHGQHPAAVLAGCEHTLCPPDSIMIELQKRLNPGKNKNPANAL